MLLYYSFLFKFHLLIVNDCDHQDFTYHAIKKTDSLHCIFFKQNHVAETCTNKYIPDHGSFVYMSGKNPSSDPTLSQFKKNLVSYMDKLDTLVVENINNYQLWY